ncbi:hypothetical protein [Winogradskyella sp. PG-2]|uniref:hypothetical protein n=1 Tax=Winogradskyella sp. PG-2 TaxID=754409 RepID=UPI000458624F|nr:hypothetical protein [Winogradskyella sp. PG-2]BAO76454.1 hypothetical protein WPG_2224 [Winogradskyella sp. PG-2]
MIKFFRKIRQKLLIENKFSKYLIYAIGEILLVMIGILLAFQANKWKEVKTEQELEIKLIKEIQNGIKSDLIDVQENYHYHEKILKSQYKVIDWLQGDLKFNDSTAYQFSMATKRTSFMVSKAPFESLKEFGLNRVSNDSIKHKIIRLYDVLYPQYEDVLSMYYLHGDKLFDSAINYFENWDLTPSVLSNIPINIPELKADHVVLMRFKYLTNFNKYLVNANSRMEELQIEIIDLMELELNK